MISLENITAEKLDRVRNLNRNSGRQINVEVQFRPEEGENLSSRLNLNVDSIPSVSRTSESDISLPAEGRKTLFCFFFMFLVFMANLISLAIIHDRTPTKEQNREKHHPPLRDISFDLASNFSEQNSIYLTIAEILLILTTSCVVVVLLFHQHKSIIFRRLFFLLAVLFLARLITMNMTMLPISSSTLYHCEAKSKSFVFGFLISRFLKLLSSLGLCFDGDIKYCGNYVYSGHTVILILNCLMADEYCPLLIVNYSIKILTACSISLILISGFDYTISIIIAYYITTRIFWIYHTMANNAFLKENEATNQISKEWWFPIFRFLEGNIKHVVPSVYNIY